MLTYFSTFVAGMGEAISEALRVSLPDVNILLTLDGLVVYATEKQPRDIKRLGFFNNSYLLLKQVGSGDLIEFTNSLHPTGILLPSKRSSFRVMFSNENQLAAVAPGTLAILEEKIANEVLFVNRTRPEIEFLVLKRREGNCFFGQRLTQHPDYKKVLAPGQLRPELASLLCWIAGVDANDVFLDPFSGPGSIPVARSKMGEYKQILAGDIDPTLLPDLKLTARKIDQKFIVGTWDATNLSTIADFSVSKIVSDPPWGVYKPVDFDTLYPAFLQEANRVLKNGGTLVILTPQKDIFKQYLSAISGLKLVKQYDILVSGKKAAVFKIHKS